MPRVEYIPIQCKTALNRVQGMPFKWSINPYSGCSHACRYCYARAFYPLQADRVARSVPTAPAQECSCNQQNCRYCYARAYYVRADHGDAGTDFETRILVKTNLPEVLARELRRPSWAGEQVALGTATDVYQPVEGRFKLTRRVLEVLRDAVTPLSVVTKSPLVIRDVDLLAELAQRVKVRVFFTITTVDLPLWRSLEPGTANPFKRLQVLRTLRDAGVPAGVLLAPILPGITDSVASIEAVAAAAVEHRAAFFGASALRLAPIVREEYLGFVATEFPELLPRYERAYSGTNAPREYQVKLQERIDEIRHRHGLDEDSMRRHGRLHLPDPPSGPAPRGGPQLALPLT